MSSRSPRVLVDCRGRLSRDAEILSRKAAASLRQLGQQLGLGPHHELSLLLCDNPTIRRLNRRWRAIDKATDVLSFPSYTLKEGQAPPEGPVGDIAISLPAARRAARQMGLSLQAHLDRLLVHGLLHLLGYDHQSSSTHRRMQQAEACLLDHNSC